ncbi:MAG TPA: hypothetical protein VJM57_00900, partial [Thermodesulfobacteriota bacterium]|nr:hypothetical protein [Thermodesulfobacteriota bacterium]
MRNSGLFLTLAQIAVALVGFITIISIFKHQKAKWDETELAAIHFMFENSFGLLFFSILPVMFNSIDSYQEAVPWLNLFLSIYLLAVFIRNGLKFLKVKPANNRVLILASLLPILIISLIEFCMYSLPFSSKTKISFYIGGLMLFLLTA